MLNDSSLSTPTPTTREELSRAMDEVLEISRSQQDILHKQMAEKTSVFTFSSKSLDEAGKGLELGIFDIHKKLYFTT